MTDLDLTFTIAGMPTRMTITGALSVHLQETLGNYTDFLTPPSQDAFTVAAMIEEGGVFFEPVAGQLEIRIKLENRMVSFTSNQETGWFDLDRRRGELLMRPNGNPENFLRVLYACRCLEQNALLLHAGGVIRNGAAWVFFGPSESGKTTTVSLSQGSTVLSDDIVLLQVEQKADGNHVLAYGVPFRGMLPDVTRTNASAEVRGIYRLRKSQEHRLAALPTGRAIAELSASIPFIMALPVNAARALRISELIERVVPVQELYYHKNDGFWDIIEGS